jgi:hypothetical protein
MAERAMDAARQLSGTRPIRRCVDTISPHLIRGARTQRLQRRPRTA